ncbi:site-specific integrase [Phocaeicola barnesiae]|uniref:site-specific integrase n=1 Tax=Phocaeicola barnesiae TaxID=376804 RepID=UPI0003A84CBD|nr:site-specific integrase [Phocaeicola barnesiae]
MRSTFSILPYINRNKVKADGTTAVLCRITVDGKSSTMATGIYCRPEDWNSKTGTIRTVRENNRLQEFRKSVGLAYDEILKKQNVVSAELLKNTLAKRAVIPTKLLQMGERERERLLARSKEINSTSTYRHSGYYQKYLKEYLTSLGKEDIEFTDITEDFGSSYKAFMKRNKNFSAQQINKCLCWLSKLVYLAVDYEILRANPLEDMEYEKKPTPKHRHISRAELKAILETPMLDPLQELGRRAFLFSTFTGLAYVDTMLLHPHHIGRTADGRRYIRINRKKTNVEAFIPLHPIAEQILDLYNTTDDTKPVFPLPSRDEMWFEIHELGVAIGRKENLSYHQSRHSFGTFLISEGIPIESIAKMMGHSGIRTTQRYAEVTDKKISKDMDNLMAVRMMYGTGKWYKRQGLPKETDLNNEQIGK